MDFREKIKYIPNILPLGGKKMMFLVGSYNEEFERKYREAHNELTRKRLLEPLGMGLDQQWLINVYGIAQKIPIALYEDNEDEFISTVTDALQIAVLEEIFHCFANIFSETQFMLDLFYSFLRDEKELEKLKETKMYKFLNFINKMGRAIQAGDKSPLNLEEFNSGQKDEEKLDRSTFYRYLKHYQKIRKW